MVNRKETDYRSLYAGLQNEKDSCGIGTIVNIDGHPDYGVFWKLKDKRKFHVRPKGRKGADREISPKTGKRTADKFCYWFNNDYVLNIVNNHKRNNGK